MTRAARPIAGAGGAEPGDDRGFALLIVLWTLTLLALMFTQLTSNARSEARLALNLRTGAAAEAAADGALYEAIFHLLDRSSAGWKPDGTMHELRLPHAVATVSARSQSGLVNPNFASPEILQALLHNLGVDAVAAKALARAISDWHVPDAQVEIGAAQYRAAGLPYGPAQSPYHSLDELGLVLGMTPALLATLAPHVSIYNRDAISPALADPIVLQSLRAVLGGDLQDIDKPGPPRNVLITAAVRGINGVKFTRQAQIALNPPRDGNLFAVLTWTRPD